MIINKKLNDKGAISIIFVITILIMMSFLAGLVNITRKNYIKNEVQGILDNSGVIALRHGINEEEWRLENIEIDEGATKQKFLSLVNKQMPSGPGELISDYKITRLEIHEVDSGNLKSGKGGYYLEAIAKVNYNAIGGPGDPTNGTKLRYKNFFTGQEEISVAQGRAKDGRGEHVIRSVSRLMLRGEDR